MDWANSRDRGSLVAGTGNALGYPAPAAVDFIQLSKSHGAANDKSETSRGRKLVLSVAGKTHPAEKDPNTLYRRGKSDWAV